MMATSLPAALGRGLARRRIAVDDGKTVSFDVRLAHPDRVHRCASPQRQQLAATRLVLVLQQNDRLLLNLEALLARFD